MATPKRNPVLLWAIVLCLALFFVVSYGQRLATKAYLEATLVDQKERLVAAQQRHQTLQQELAYESSDVYVEEAARNDLGMVQPGDELLIVVEGKSSTAVPATNIALPTTVEPPLWQQWLHRMGF